MQEKRNFLTININIHNIKCQKTNKNSYETVQKIKKYSVQSIKHIIIIDIKWIVPLKQRKDDLSGQEESFVKERKTSLKKLYPVERVARSFQQIIIM